MSTPDRTAALLRKIKALRAKTTAAGATEAEAMAAAEHAAHLMAEHNLTETDVARIQYRRHVIPIKDMKIDAKKAHPVGIAGAFGVEHITGCKCYGAHGRIEVVGDEVGIEIACYLIDLMHRASLRAWERERKARVALLVRSWVRTSSEPITPGIIATLKDVGNKNLREQNGATDRAARYGFLLGFCYRISQRLQQMPPARAVPSDVAEVMIGGKPEKPDMSFLEGSDRYAAGAGARAGENVPLAMGVRSNGPGGRMIGGKG